MSSGHPPPFFRAGKIFPKSKRVLNGGVALKIKALDATHLLVILAAQEKQALGLALGGTNWGSLHCRLTIARIFAAACSGTGFPLRKGGQIAVRAMETIDGQCVLVFSTISPSVQHHGKRRIYTVKPPVSPTIYRFESAGHVMDALGHLACSGIECPGRLFLQNQQYLLALSPRLGQRCRADGILKEYGKLWGKGRTAEAMVEEHGKLLSTDAVVQIGQRCKT